jgi:hypothetical protein
VERYLRKVLALRCKSSFDRLTLAGYQRSKEGRYVRSSDCWKRIASTSACPPATNALPST